MDAPESITAEALDHETIRVRWNPPEPREAFVYRRTKGDQSWRVQRVPAGVTGHVLRGLWRDVFQIAVTFEPVPRPAVAVEVDTAKHARR